VYPRFEAKNKTTIKITVVIDLVHSY